MDLQKLKEAQTVLYEINALLNFFQNILNKADINKYIYMYISSWFESKRYN